MTIILMYLIVCTVCVSFFKLFSEVLSFRRTVFIIVCVTLHSISLLITYEKLLQRTAQGAVNFVVTATD